MANADFNRAVSGHKLQVMAFTAPLFRHGLRSQIHWWEQSSGLLS
jgi:hypothetical protein